MQSNTQRARLIPQLGRSAGPTLAPTLPTSVPGWRPPATSATLPADTLLNVYCASGNPAHDSVTFARANAWPSLVVCPMLSGAPEATEPATRTSPVFCTAQSTNSRKTLLLSRVPTIKCHAPSATGVVLRISTHPPLQRRNVTWLLYGTCCPCTRTLKNGRVGSLGLFPSTGEYSLKEY